MIKLQRTIRH